MNLFRNLLVLSLISFNLANETPIIGILTQETFIVDKYLPEKFDSFIAAGYVKLLESGGARIVPIWLGQTDEYYVRVINSTNGILFPGGGVYFNESGGYGETAKKIFDLASTINGNGVYYPIWGICLGMQVFGFAAVGKDIRIECLLKRISIPLDFTEDFENSRLFSTAPKDIVDILKTQNVTYNFHKYCMTESTMTENNMLDNWKILSTNADSEGLTFVSSMEHKKYPFYGVQFHPERNAFEFKKDVGISHSASGIRAMQYFANFFVEECRKNLNSFGNQQMELDNLIYNFNPIFTGRNNSAYEQIYGFKISDSEKAVASVML